MTRTSPHYEDLRTIPSSFRTPWSCPPPETQCFLIHPLSNAEPRHSRKGYLTVILQANQAQRGQCNFEVHDPAALSKGNARGTAAWSLERLLPLNQSCAEFHKKMCHSFIRGREEWEKLGHCPGQMRQSSLFCIWCFMCVPKIEPLNQTPLCRWDNHCALYNFTVGMALCSYSDINLSQFCRQGFTYFTNSNWMYLTFVLILYPTHKASLEGKSYPLFHEIPKALSSN